jgi:peptidyl-tRNA hydrolase, PTH1 family
VAGNRVIVGLGNPGREYALTRHNVGWWLADALAERWGAGRFRQDRGAAVATVRVEPYAVRLIKPLSFMNRSGQVLGPLRRMGALDLTRDLLVLVDDVALEPGRARFRPTGSAGGHNGLKSVEQALGTRDYPRLRIGVGQKPPARDLADWVLAPPSKADRQAIVDRFPALMEGVETWLRDGTQAAMDQTNN